MTNKKILIIIPAFNEARTISPLIKEIKKKHPLLSILVVNDGSTDSTPQVAGAAGALVVSHPYNLGIGGAVQTGFKIAKEEGFGIAVQIDGDGQHNPDSLKDLLKPVTAGELDLCIGSRFLSKNSPFQSTFTRRIGIRFFSLLLRCLTGIHLTDPTSGYRAVNKKIIDHFAQSYPTDFPEPEAIKVAKRLGARIGEVPVKMRKRLGGVSSIRYGKTIYYMIKVTFAILIDALRRKIK